MLPPERRTRWDLTAAAVVAVIVFTVAAALWWTSDAHRTTLTTAAGPAPSNATSAAGSGSLPTALTEAWRAPSPATPVPLAADGTAVTGAAGVVAGYVMLHQSIPLLSHEHVLEVNGLAVDPAQQGRGIGRALITALRDEATRRGAGRLLLEVRADNPSALSLYAATGFGGMTRSSLQRFTTQKTRLNSTLTSKHVISGK